MASQGPGRKRTPNRNAVTPEEDALNVIAKEAEARLVAKRAARAEAREIRMKELERQQKEIYQVQKKYYGLENLDNKWGDIEQWMEDSERYTRHSQRHVSVSDDEECMSVGSRSSVRLDLDSVGAQAGLSHTLYSHSHKSTKKKKKRTKHSSDISNGYNNGYSTISSRGSLYENSLCSNSLRSSTRTLSEYSGHLGSSSRTSSRASSRCASPVENSSSSVASILRKAASSSGLSRDLDHVTIPDMPNLDDSLDRDFFEKGSSRASTLSNATLTSLGGASSRKGSGSSSVTADTEASIQDIKEIHELKDQIHDVEAKYMQSLKEIKDSLADMEGKYRKAMVSSAQLDNEKSNLMYEVDTLKDSLMELEELLAETRRECEEKSKDLEREKHAHSILQFQFSEQKEALKQSEELLTEIRHLHIKQEGFVREISDLQETIEWKDKKIGALERQKEFSDAIRNERDELRDEVVQLKDILKKHGIVLGPDLRTNGEVEENVTGGSACTELQQGSSVLEIRLRKLVDERENLLEQVKTLKEQHEQTKKRHRGDESCSPEGEVLENDTDADVVDMPRDANRQVSDLKFKLVKSEQEISALEQNVTRLEGQVTRYKSAAENAEKVEDELKAEKRKLQRELRTSLDKIEELEASNSHLNKRLEKMKSYRGTAATP
ncbi:leucine-rich repeat flightless-interacting protein 2 isoform X22 [Ictalurus punctatus]|uniref:Leucine-rich repeat flightless-interacting protein 2 isoform X22 n=1 Tax=Ictalurus punctatus TaxID=7998 RepID=A0A2D0R3K5_ICTPU|nr:leucine-rich repeat flightless-interacting protein 2 isoform X22 [Ictalurus punctatus]